MPLLDRTCPCGKSFKTYRSVNSKACSRSCSRHFFPTKPRRGQVVACETCGTDFYRSPTEIRKGVGRFCSRVCVDASQRGEIIAKACGTCGTEMSLRPSQVRRRYCSKACEGIGRTKRLLDRVHNGRAARLDNHGYVLLWEPTHPNRSYKGWQPEHRLVVERVIGRYLTSSEHVDHINEIKDDNRPENLQVLSPSQHSSKTAADMVARRLRMEAELAEYRRRFGQLD